MLLLQQLRHCGQLREPFAQHVVVALQLPAASRVAVSLFSQPAGQKVLRPDGALQVRDRQFARWLVPTANGADGVPRLLLRSGSHSEGGEKRKKSKMNTHGLGITSPWHPSGGVP